MKKTLLLVLAFLALAFAMQQVHAQAGFTFSKSSQTYSKLSGAISLTQGRSWTSDSVYEAPIGFSFKMNGKPLTKINIASGSYAGYTQGSVHNGFALVGTGLMDRSIVYGTSRASDIRYMTSGTSGNRIFKLEVYNAGFEDEYFNNGQLKDSISFQLWLYEGSNVAEFRYGSSMVSDFSTYFGPRMMCGFIKDMDTTTMMFDRFYVVNGNPASPTLDSTTTFPGTKGLSAVPASGTVFRFTPKGTATTGVGTIEHGFMATVYPTVFSQSVSVRRTSTEPLRYVVYDQAGRIISDGTIRESQVSLDLSTLAAGAYLMQLNDENGGAREVHKLIKP